jgi:hypothetical protein
MICLVSYDKSSFFFRVGSLCIFFFFFVYLFFLISVLVIFCLLVFCFFFFFYFILKVSVLVIFCLLVLVTRQPNILIVSSSDFLSFFRF